VVEILRVVPSVDDADAFGEFVHGRGAPPAPGAGRRLRRGPRTRCRGRCTRVVVAALGPRCKQCRTPAGYLWRVGQTAVRKSTRRRVHEVSDGRVFELEAVDDRATPHNVEPAPRWRAGGVVAPAHALPSVLVHGHGYTLSEAADALGCFRVHDPQSRGARPTPPALRRWKVMMTDSHEPRPELGQFLRDRAASMEHDAAPISADDVTKRVVRGSSNLDVGCGRPRRVAHGAPPPARGGRRGDSRRC